MEVKIKGIERNKQTKEVRFDWYRGKCKKEEVGSEKDNFLQFGSE